MLNGAALNASRLNVWALGKKPVTFSGDAVGEVASVLAATRLASASGEAVALSAAEITISAQRWLAGSLLSTQQADIAVSMVRGGRGTGVIEVGGSLYYTRLILGSGGAEIQLVSISDVGVVYGEGAAISRHFAEMSAGRLQLGSGDAISLTGGSLSPSAIRVPATAAIGAQIPLVAQLDSAHVTAGGVRYINGFSDAIAYLEIEDDGFRRQVFIGTLDLEPIATGFATATRIGRGDASMLTSISLDTRTTRRAEGAAVLRGAADLGGDIIVRGDGAAVIRVVASLTGYVYRRGGVMEAISTVATHLAGVRARLGRASAPLVCIVQTDGSRARQGEGSFVLEINSESSAQDFNFAGMDDDDELFYRPAQQREFFRAASTREWRRS